ncbi:hypothetical protein SAMN06295912_103234 [Sphingomonas laterariae]|uniref:Outer membrane protein beta-barrel domain-containing protein n=2 Tax=Edaphosphingomonas laterariae TaxID=861865 RepID=A0A239D676_9SPHN|nr:hypothetical protein SAMN06295912_103234 [Sphingomonas laterariae]
MRQFLTGRAGGIFRLAPWVTSCMVLMHAGTANAQAARDRFWLEASYFWTSNNTTVSVEDRDSQEAASRISLEKDLGFERDDSLPEFRAGAKLGGGFRVVVEYMGINRKAEAQIDRRLGFGKHTFEASADVRSRFETDIYRIGIGWDAFRGENYAIGIIGGLHATNFVVRLEGEATIGNQSVGAVTEKRDALAPLPTVGAYALFDVTPHFTLQGRVDYIDLTLNNAGGRLINAEASLMYNITDNLGVGVGFRHVDYKLEMVKRDWTGSIKYRVNGPSVILKAALP